MEASLEQLLRSRIEYEVILEAQGDVAALYELIDPLVRESREREYDFEPKHTLDTIREFVARIHSAQVANIDIEKFTLDGGESRAHRPTAIVCVGILYNDSHTPASLRTPWVLNNGTWYTRALGKSFWPLDSPTC